MQCFCEKGEEDLRWNYVMDSNCIVEDVKGPHCCAALFVAWGIPQIFCVIRQKCSVQNLTAVKASLLKCILLRHWE